MSTTTIQINEDTAGLLKKYKEQFQLHSYDEVIKKCMALKVAEHAAHYQGYLGKVDRKELLKNLRDKRDRL